MNTSLDINRKFEAFYNEYYEQVFWYIYKRINHKEDSQDLTGDVFCSCYKNFANYDPNKSSIKTWLFVITNNRLKNYYRDKKITVSFEELAEKNYITDDGIIVESIEIDSFRNLLADAISTLQEKHQLIIVLKYFGNKKSDEIAKILNMSSVNVRVIISRTLKKINEYFLEHGWNGEI